MTIGERIRQARRERGLTQKQLGEVSETSETTVKQYELGKRQPRLEQLQRIAAALDVPWTKLAGEEVFEISVGTQAAKKIQQAEDAENAILELLRTFYGKAECKEVSGKYGPSCYYLVGKENNQFVLGFV